MRQGKEGSAYIDFDPSIEQAVGHPLSTTEYIPLALRRQLGKPFVYFSAHPIGLEGAPQIEMTPDFRKAIHAAAQRIHALPPSQR